MADNKSSTKSDDANWVAGISPHESLVAMCLGQFLAEFAMLEIFLMMILNKVLGESTLAGSLLGPVQSISTRCEMVREAVANCDLLDVDKAALSGFVEDIQRMNAIRNRYVHGLYETHVTTGAVRVTPFALSTTRRRQDAEPVTEQALLRHIATMRSITNQIAGRYFNHRIALASDPSPERSPQKID
jgi:hypothetical protein